MAHLHIIGRLGLVASMPVKFDPTNPQQIWW